MCLVWIGVGLGMVWDSFFLVWGVDGGGRTGLGRGWFRARLLPVRNGLSIAWEWFGCGLDVVWAWFGDGSVLVRSDLGGRWIGGVRNMRPEVGSSLGVVFGD